LLSVTLLKFNFIKIPKSSRLQPLTLVKSGAQSRTVAVSRMTSSDNRGTFAAQSLIIRAQFVTYVVQRMGLVVSSSKLRSVA
jgi:hypothetical protein